MMPCPMVLNGVSALLLLLDHLPCCLLLLLFSSRFQLWTIATGPSTEEVSVD